MIARACHIIFFVAALTVSSLTVKAQLSVANADTASIAPARISLLTAAPGKEVYQLEGHSGLRMQYDGMDVVANWGLFDFDTPNFVYRFVKGETDYCVGLWPYGYFIAGYAAEHRRVVEQELNLTREQARKLIELVNTAIRPENRTYRYNYVLDNCATRPISFIEKATGTTIRFPQAAAELDREVTFRDVMTHFHRNYPWYQFGIDIALGSGIDYPIDIRQSGFAPVVLEEIAAKATIGDSIPLVKDTVILVDGPPEGPVLPPTPWFLTPLAVMWVLCGICLAVAVTASGKRRLMRGFQTVFFAAAGIAGSVIAFLVFISSHEATSPNWIILWLNPLCLLVPLLIYIRRMREVLRCYMMLNLFMIAVYGITCAFGVQIPNKAFLPLALADVIMSISYLKQTRETIR